MSNSMIAQINIYLGPEDHKAFKSYAATCGLDASELVKLLIVREIKLCRLQKLHVSQSLHLPARRPRGEGGERLPTITAHYKSQSAVNQFDQYAKSCGLNRSRAGAWLLMKELQEQWLKNAMTLHWEAGDDTPKYGPYPKQIP